MEKYRIGLIFLDKNHMFEFLRGEVKAYLKEYTSKILKDTHSYSTDSLYIDFILPGRYIYPWQYDELFVCSGTIEDEGKYEYLYDKLVSTEELYDELLKGKPNLKVSGVFAYRSSTLSCIKYAISKPYDSFGTYYYVLNGEIHSELGFEKQLKKNLNRHYYISKKEATKVALETIDKTVKYFQKQIDELESKKKVLENELIDN